MVKDVIRYDRLIEDALRGVVRDVLTQIAEHGLPGNHHFYITFRTAHPGVEIPESLSAQYPEEMTIVLQHQYWELSVEEQMFRVTLSFNKLPEGLVIPFSAVTTFADPSVQFGLQFQGQMDSANEAADVESGARPPTEAGPEEANDAALGQIVTLDSFRKK